MHRRTDATPRLAVRGWYPPMPTRTRGCSRCSTRSARRARAWLSVLLALQRPQAVTVTQRNTFVAVGGVAGLHGHAQTMVEPAQELLPRIIAPLCSTRPFIDALR